MFIDIFRRFKRWNLSRKGYAQSAKIRHSQHNQPTGWRHVIVMIICLFVNWGVAGGALLWNQSNEWNLGLESMPLLFGMLFFLILIAYCLDAMRATIFHTTREPILITLVSSLQIFAVWLVFNYHPYIAEHCHILSCLPLALGALFIAPLLGLRVAFCLSIYTSAIAALMGPKESQFIIFMMGLMSSSVVAIMIRRQRKRSLIIYTIAVLVMVKLLFLLMCQYRDVDGAILANPRWDLLAVFTICFFCVIMANILLPIPEYLFGMVSDQSLIELTDLNHPLLKRLQIDAPGTYHHSLMVAIIAEAAAESIGANPLLTRVCSYFHDVGKLTHPEYFTENNREENFHEDLHPHMSSIIILNHVKEGIELAYKYKLNRVIREAILQHHGTSMISFFYKKACEMQTEGQPLPGEEEYRYPGPRVHRKEIAILSIADACEACIRSLTKPSPQKIRAKVEEIIAARFNDHQLDEADLTFNELNIVKETIIKTLSGMMHGRVQYPHAGKAHHEYSAG